MAFRSRLFESVVVGGASWQRGAPWRVAQLGRSDSLGVLSLADVQAVTDHRLEGGGGDDVRCQLGSKCVQVRCLSEG